MARTIVEEYNTFIALVVHNNEIIVRLSAQVYLTLADFEYAAKVLKKVCERVRKGEWQAAAKQTWDRQSTTQ
jgi:selenocysteine lyase/cysteine desulfurase